MVVEGGVVVVNRGNKEEEDEEGLSSIFQSPFSIRTKGF